VKTETQARDAAPSRGQTLELPLSRPAPTPDASVRRGGEEADKPASAPKREESKPADSEPKE
jgi:hypothetical protein